MKQIPVSYGSELRLHLPRMIPTCVLCLALSANAQSPCGPFIEVLRVGMNETEITSYVSEARRLYDWACSLEDSTTGISRTDELKARYRTFFSAEAKVGRSTLEEYRREECTLSEQNVASKVSNELRSKRVDPSVLDAWTGCLRSQGILVTPYIATYQTEASFTLKRSSGHEVTLQGVTSKHFECRIGDQPINSEGPPIKIPLTPDAVNLYCNRRSEQQDLGDGRRVTVYPATLLSLDLSTGAHIVEFSERREGTIANEFVQLQERLAVLEESSSQLTLDLRSLKLTLGTISVKSCNEIHESRDAGIVTALQTIAGHPTRYAVEGYVSSTREDLIQNENAVARSLAVYDETTIARDNIPYASISFPVAAGEVWQVNCGNPETATVRFRILTLEPSFPKPRN